MYYEESLAGKLDGSGSGKFQIGPLPQNQIDYFLGYLVVTTTIGAAASYLLQTLGGYPLGGFAGQLGVLGPVYLKPGQYVILQVSSGPINAQIVGNLIGDTNADPAQLVARPVPTAAGANLTLPTLPNLTVTGPTDLQGPVSVEGATSFKALVTASNFEFIRMVDEFAGAELGAKISAADSDLGGSAGELWVPPGTYSMTTAPTISPNHCLRCWGGLITVGITTGIDAFVLPNAASLIGHGFGGPQTQLVVGPTANIARLITNSAKDGTQEYVYVEGFNITLSTGATVSGPGVIDLVAVFLNSALRNLVINCNDLAGQVGPAVRLAGGANSGFGPVRMDHCWILNSFNDGVLITDSGVGASFAWLKNVAVEHWRSGFHAFHIKSGGTLIQTTIRDFHTENAKVFAAPGAAIYIEKGGNTIIDGGSVLAANLANKKGIWIANDAANANIRIRGPITNNNLVTPILQDDLNGISVGAVNLPGYDTPDVGFYPDVEQALTFPGAGGAVNIDMALGNYCSLVATDGVAFTINNPTNFGKQQTLALEITNASGGVMGNVTFGAGFAFMDGSFVKPPNGNRRLLLFRRRGGGNWIQMAPSTGNM